MRKIGSPRIIFFDFKQAFDRVHWPTLFSKLAQYGFNEEITNSIKLLYQSTSASHSPLTPSSQIHKGVIQGGILPPLLFNYFINDLAITLQKQFCIFYYADDLAILTHGKPNTKQAISQVETWCEQNKLEINKEKSGILPLSSRHQLTSSEKHEDNIGGIP